jgi:hypothetical protein
MNRFGRLIGRRIGLMGKQVLTFATVRRERAVTVERPEQATSYRQTESERECETLKPNESNESNESNEPGFGGSWCRTARPLPHTK